MIDLYYWPTPNGHKASIMLEEVGLPYRVCPINILSGEQFTPEFLAINPNNRVPAIVDHEGPEGEPYSIFESGAILIYLAEKSGKLWPSSAKHRYDVLQWLMFQMGGVGPMMGQAMYFQRIAAPNGEEHPFAIKRYRDETRRLLEVLNTRLEGRDWLAGDAYSIADMATYPWARAYPWASVGIEGLDHLSAWFERIDARPAVQEALTIPKAQPAFWGVADADGFAAENAARFAGDVKS